MPCSIVCAEVAPLYSHTSVMDPLYNRWFSVQSLSRMTGLSPTERGGYLSGDAICHFLPDSLIADAFTVISPPRAAARAAGLLRATLYPALQGGPRAH